MVVAVAARIIWQFQFFQLSSPSGHHSFHQRHSVASLLLIIIIIFLALASRALLSSSLPFLPSSHSSFDFPTPTLLVVAANSDTQYPPPIHLWRGLNRDMGVGADSSDYPSPRSEGPGGPTAILVAAHDSFSPAPKMADQISTNFVEGTRPRLSVRRTREPPKNTAGQIYCDHPDCQPTPSVFRRPCEWKSVNTLPLPSDPCFVLVVSPSFFRD